MKPAPRDATKVPQRVSADDRTRRIAEHAYYLAEARGFEAGHELEDWLAAERLVDDRLAGSKPT